MYSACVLVGNFIISHFTLLTSVYIHFAVHELLISCFTIVVRAGLSSYNPTSWAIRSQEISQYIQWVLADLFASSNCWEERKPPDHFGLDPLCSALKLNQPTRKLHMIIFLLICLINEACWILPYCVSIVDPVECFKPILSNYLWALMSHSCNNVVIHFVAAEADKLHGITQRRNSPRQKSIPWSLQQHLLQTLTIFRAQSTYLHWTSCSQSIIMTWLSRTGKDYLHGQEGRTQCQGGTRRSICPEATDSGGAGVETFVRAQYLEATFREGSQETTNKDDPLGVVCWLRSLAAFLKKQSINVQVTCQTSYKTCTMCFEYNTIRTCP